MSADHFSYEGRDLEAMSFAENYHRWILDVFSPYIGKLVAEVGAGSGNFSSLLLEKDIDKLIAIEPSDEMYPLLRKKLAAEGRAVPRQGFFVDVAKEYEGSLDTILYVNVLEHIEDDAEELRHAYRALKVGGYVCVFVPAFPFLYSELDASIGHFRRYTKRSTVEPTRKAGFEIEKVSYFDIAGILPWYVYFTLLKKHIASENVRVYDSLVVPIMRRIESVIPVPIGKNVLLVGKKVR